MGGGQGQVLYIAARSSTADGRKAEDTWRTESQRRQKRAAVRGVGGVVG